MEIALGAEAGVSGGLSYFTPSLLLRLDDLLPVHSVKEEPDRIFEGRPCHCLVGTSENGIFKRLTVSRAPLCVVELVERYDISSCEVEATTTFKNIAWNA